MAHQERPRVTVGVDTHLDLHVAHAKDQLGRCLETVSIPTTPAGYQHLLAWARGLGEVEAFGIEGTGCYGAALARFLAAQGQVVLESTGPTAKPAADAASPTRSTPRPPPALCRPARPPPCPKPAPPPWR